MAKTSVKGRGLDENFKIWTFPLSSLCSHCQVFWSFGVSLQGCVIRLTLYSSNLLLVFWLACAVTTTETDHTIAHAGCAGRAQHHRRSGGEKRKRRAASGAKCRKACRLSHPLEGNIGEWVPADKVARIGRLTLALIFSIDDRPPGLVFLVSGSSRGWRLQSLRLCCDSAIRT